MPSVKAQAAALQALRADGTAMQRAAFDAVSLLDDKPGVCAAIDADLRPDAKQWALAAEALAHMKDACVASLAKTIIVVPGWMAAGDDHLEILRRYDAVFDLDAATRAKISKAILARRARRPPNGSARTSTRRQRSSASPQRRSPSEPSLCRPPSRAARSSPRRR